MFPRITGIITLSCLPVSLPKLSLSATAFNACNPAFRNRTCTGQLPLPAFPDFPASFAANCAYNCTISSYCRMYSRSAARLAGSWCLHSASNAGSVSSTMPTSSLFKIVRKIRSTARWYNGRSRGHLSISAVTICSVTCTLPVRPFQTSLVARLSRKSVTLVSLERRVLA